MNVMEIMPMVVMRMLNVQTQKEVIPAHALPASLVMAGIVLVSIYIHSKFFYRRSIGKGVK